MKKSEKEIKVKLTPGICRKCRKRPVEDITEWCDECQRRDDDFTARMMGLR